MDRHLFDYLESRQLPTGRRTFVLQRMLAAAEELGADEIADACEEAIDGARETMQLELGYDRAKSKKSTARGNAKQLDEQADAQLGAMYKIADGHTVGPDDDDIVEMAGEFLEEVFPLGVGAVIHQEYEQQLATMEALLGRFSGDLGTHVDELNLTRQVQRVAEIVPAYRAELEQEEDEEVTYAQVKAARMRGLDEMAALVFLVLARYPGIADVDERQQREKLLAEFHRQNEFVARAYRRNRRPEDIDPDTGEPLDDDQAADEEPVVEPV